MREKWAVLAGVCVLGLCVGCGQQADGAAQGHEISEADVSETENDGAEADGEGGLSGGDALPDEAGGLADEAGAAETEADSADVQLAADDWNRAGLESGEPSPSAKEEKGLEIPENGRRLTEEELAVFKRGRNAHPGTMAKNATVSDYKKATGFEALMGYLYLKGDWERLFELVRQGLTKGEFICDMKHLP